MIETSAPSPRFWSDIHYMCSGDRKLDKKTSQWIPLERGTKALGEEDFFLTNYLVLAYNTSLTLKSKQKY